MYLGDAETECVRVEKKDLVREAERGGRRRKEDKEDFVESQEMQGRAWKERERKGRETVEKSKYKWRVWLIEPDTELEIWLFNRVGED